MKDKICLDTEIIIGFENKIDKLGEELISAKQPLMNLKLTKGNGGNVRIAYRQSLSMGRKLLQIVEN